MVSKFCWNRLLLWTDTITVWRSSCPNGKLLLPRALLHNCSVTTFQEASSELLLTASCVTQQPGPITHQESAAALSPVFARRSAVWLEISQRFISSSLHCFWQIVISVFVPRPFIWSLNRTPHLYAEAEFGIDFDRREEQEPVTNSNVKDQRSPECFWVLNNTTACVFN